MTETECREPEPMQRDLATKVRSLRAPGPDGVGAGAEMVERRQTPSELAILRAEMQQMLEWHFATHTVSALAHEVNQPLASICALAAAASRILAADGSTAFTQTADRARLEQILQRIAGEAERAGGVVRDLMKSLHTPDTRLEDLALATLLPEAVRVARGIGFDDCEMLIECAEDLRPVRVNRLQVEKLLLNLIGNAVEAMRLANQSVRRIWLSAEVHDAGRAARVTVRDAGPGIDRELEPQMFQPFVTTKASGMGMGLTICRTLVEALGGRLWYQAHEGPGASFCFTLPFAAPDTCVTTRRC